MEAITHVCGQCGREYHLNDLIRSYYSDTGWYCIDCWDYVKEMGEDYSSGEVDYDGEQGE